MNNLSSRQGEGIRAAIEKTGATLIDLPLHSPDSSPIEPAFGTNQQRLRGLASRTQDGLWTSM